ncbi:potassium channel subfamily K member 6 [Tachysurus fulvidraco]|uniref:potassium channel subfamily K member 6 n=1 Tax=Tachysurus fulvidraco TaxID=1234273 RepID=UPI000F4F8641|nr:potassium channel subfamily K member 6 [Tachysurus fulvidraco]
MAASSRSCIVVVALVFIYVVYLLIGASVFSTLEKPLEEKVRAEMFLLKQELINNTSCINISTLDRLLEKLINANKYGVTLGQNTSENSNWDLASALFFSNTLVTTIGYGHTTPLSDGGKAFSIVYALIGVPFTMLVLSACVQRLMVPLNLRPVASWCRRFGWHPHTASTIHFVLLLFLVIVMFFLVPAIVFSIIEGSWSFLEAFYFCFISLFTIGLGDFVPGEQPIQKLRPLYKISVTIYLFLGLMAMYFVLRSFHKLADVQGWTAFFHLPSLDDEGEEDNESTSEEHNVCERDRKPLDPNARVSYNSISR